jgi:Diacylglycerol acyltransferase
MIKYLLIVGIAFLLHSTSGKQSILLSAFSSLFFFFAFCYLDTSYKKDGKKWHAFQHSTMWSPLSRYFNAGITSQASLDNDQQYIFCSFPHGACKNPALLRLIR